MNARELVVPGAWEITPQLHADSRGTFFEWFTGTRPRTLALIFLPASAFFVWAGLAGTNRVWADF